MKCGLQNKMSLRFLLPDPGPTGRHAPVFGQFALWSGLPRLLRSGQSRAWYARYVSTESSKGARR